LKEDTLLWYKSQLRKYREEEFLVIFHFHDRHYSIDCTLETQYKIEVDCIKKLNALILDLTPVNSDIRPVKSILRQHSSTVHQSSKSNKSSKSKKLGKSYSLPESQSKDNELSDVIVRR
jgi:hypothetical protein